jgi:hypothetical protein
MVSVSRCRKSHPKQEFWKTTTRSMQEFLSPWMPWEFVSQTKLRLWGDLQLHPVHEDVHHGSYQLFVQ